MPLLFPVSNANRWHCTSALSNYPQLSLAWLAVSFCVSLSLSQNKARSYSTLSGSRGSQQLVASFQNEPLQHSPPQGGFYFLVMRKNIYILVKAAMVHLYITRPHYKGHKKCSHQVGTWLHRSYAFSCSLLCLKTSLHFLLCCGSAAPGSDKTK